MNKPTDFSKLPWINDWATHRALHCWSDEVVNLIEFDHLPVVFMDQMGQWEYGVATRAGKKVEKVHERRKFKGTAKQAKASVEVRLTPPWQDLIMEKILFNATLASKDLNSLWHEIIDDR